MADWFDFAGVRSTSLGVYVQDFPPLTLPEERAKFETVPGRSGSLTLLEGDAVYDDIVLAVNCFVLDTSKLDQISTWLRGSGALVLGNMPDRYYDARCVNQIEMDKIMRGREHRTFAAVFRCQPYRYIYPPVAAYALDATIKTVATQAGSGTPSPENVRPIVGKSTVTVTRTGKNIAPLAPAGGMYTPTADGKVAVSGTSWASGSVCNILGAFQATEEVLKLSGQTVSISGGSPNVSFNLTYYDGATWTIKTVNGGSLTFEIPANCIVTRLHLGVGANVTVSETVWYQVEIAPAATSWEAYAAADYTLTPSAALYGMAGYEDEIGSDGHEAHKTALVTFIDASGFQHMSAAQLTNTAIFQCNLPTAPPSEAYPVAISSHFPLNNNGYATDSELFYIFNALRIRVLKSRLSGWSDALSDAQKVALFNTWLGSNAVQVVYQIATPTTATVAPVHIYSATGTDTVLSDGAVTEYTFGAVESILLTAPADIVNTGTAEAIPTITVVGSGDIDLTIGGRAIHIDGLASAITIDCETGMAYNGATDLTSTVTMDYYPWTIQPGTNAVAWTGSVTSVTITPAWRYV